MEIKSVLESYVAAWHVMDFARIETFYGEDLIDHSNFGQSSREEMMGFMRRMNSEFDQTFVLEDMIVQDNRAALRWHESGRAVGPFNGVPGSGEIYNNIMIEMVHLRDNLICERWIQRDVQFYMKHTGW